MHSLRGHHPASGRVTGIPQYRRPHHVSSSECACAHTADGCLASTRSADLRCVHACRCDGLRSLHTRDLSAATEWSSGVARHNPPAVLPSVGPTRPQPRALGPKEEGHLPKSPSRSIVGGRIGRGGGRRSPHVACLAAAGGATARRCGGSLPPRCVPSRHLQHHPTPRPGTGSAAGATVAMFAPCAREPSRRL